MENEQMRTIKEERIKKTLSSCHRGLIWRDRGDNNRPIGLSLRFILVFCKMWKKNIRTTRSYFPKNRSRTREGEREKSHRQHNQTPPPPPSQSILSAPLRSVPPSLSPALGQQQNAWCQCGHGRERESSLPASFSSLLPFLPPRSHKSREEGPRIPKHNRESSSSSSSSFPHSHIALILSPSSFLLRGGPFQSNLLSTRQQQRWRRRRRRRRLHLPRPVLLLPCRSALPARLQ